MPQSIKLQKDRYNGQFVYSLAVATGTTSAPIVIPQEANTITIGLYCNSSSGKVQYTLDGATVAEADNAIWFDWAAGTVAATTVDSLISPVTCIRAVSVSGEVTLKIVG